MALALNPAGTPARGVADWLPLAWRNPVAAEATTGTPASVSETAAALMLRRMMRLVTVTVFLP
jgi:hypothetical protein